MGETTPNLRGRGSLFLPALPPELWFQIFEHVIYVRGIMDRDAPEPFDKPGCRLPHENFPVKEYKASLVSKRSLVLVCRRWNVLAKPLLYQVLTIGQQNVRFLHRSLTETQVDPGSAAEAPPLGSLVRRIELNTVDQVPNMAEILRCTHRLEIFSVNCLLNDLRSLPTPLIAALTSVGHASLRKLSFRGAYPGFWDWPTIIRSCIHLQTIFLANPEVGDGFCPLEVLTNSDLSFLSVGHVLSDTNSSASHASLQAPPSLQGHFLLSSKFYIALEEWRRLLARHGHRFRTIYLELHDTERNVQQCLDMFSKYCPNLQHFILVTLNFRRLAAALPFSFPPTITHLGLYAKQEGAFSTLFSDLADWGEERTPFTPKLKVLRLLNPSVSDVLRGEGLADSFGPLLRSLPFQIQDRDGFKL